MEPRLWPDCIFWQPTSEVRLITAIKALIFWVWVVVMKEARGSST